MKIGFAILSHDHPEQLLRLAKTLGIMFDAPPISIHHDFTQRGFDSAVFPNNVRFVMPHIDTRWGDISLGLAALKALEELRRHTRPDWYVLLSGSDYPVRRAEEIVRDLSSAKYDAFLDHQKIHYRKLPPNARRSFNEIAYDRYCAYRFWLPFPSRKRLHSGSFPFWKRHFLVRRPNISRLLISLQNLISLQHPLQMAIFGGEFWFHANDGAIDRLLSHPSDKLIQYLYNRASPCESLFHTVLCNQPDLQISAQHKRYIDWSQGGPHPKWLEIADVPLIISSGAHFARKFRPDGAVQDFIDRSVLGL